MENITYEITCANWTRKIKVPVPDGDGELNKLDHANEAMTRIMESYYQDFMNGEIEKIELGQFMTAKDIADDDPYNSVVTLTTNIMRFASRHQEAEEMEAYFEKD
jgi:hypothetical protein